MTIYDFLMVVKGDCDVELVSFSPAPHESERHPLEHREKVNICKWGLNNFVCFYVARLA